MNRYLLVWKDGSPLYQHSDTDVKCFYTYEGAKSRYNSFSDDHKAKTRIFEVGTELFPTRVTTVEFK